MGGRRAGVATGAGAGEAIFARRVSIKSASGVTGSAGFFSEDAKRGVGGGFSGAAAEGAFAVEGFGFTTDSLAGGSLALRTSFNGEGCRAARLAARLLGEGGGWLAFPGHFLGVTAQAGAIPVEGTGGGGGAEAGFEDGRFFAAADAGVGFAFALPEDTDDGARTSWETSGFWGPFSSGIARLLTTFSGVGRAVVSRGEGGGLALLERFLFRRAEGDGPLFAGEVSLMVDFALEFAGVAGEAGGPEGPGVVVMAEGAGVRPGLLCTRTEGFADTQTSGSFPFLDLGECFRLFLAGAGAESSLTAGDCRRERVLDLFPSALLALAAGGFAQHGDGHTCRFPLLISFRRSESTRSTSLKERGRGGVVAVDLVILTGGFR